MSDYTMFRHTWVILPPILPFKNIDMHKLKEIFEIFLRTERIRLFSRPISHVLSVFWALKSPCVGAGHWSSGGAGLSTDVTQ